MESKECLLAVTAISILFSNICLANNNIEEKIVEDFYSESETELMEDTNFIMGYRLTDYKNFLENSRIEQSLSQKNLVLDDISYERTRLMTNFVYDLNRNQNLNLNIGMGAGFVNITDDLSNSQLNPTYQMMAGMLYKFRNTEKVKLEMGYSYQDDFTDNKQLNSLNADSYGAFQGSGHSISAEINYEF